MKTIEQKNIDQYLEGKNLSKEQREKALLAITHVVYKRNQDAVLAEDEKDNDKREQLLRSVEEYDQMIESKINEVLGGESVEIYDF